MSGRDVIFPKEIAERTGLSYHAVLREIESGALPAVKRRSRILVRVEDYRAWLEPDASDQAAAATPPRRRRGSHRASEAGSIERLTAIEGGRG